MEIESIHLEELIGEAPDEVKASFSTRHYDKGSFILYPEEPNERLHIVLEGHAEVFKQNYEGAMIVLFNYGAYTCFGELELFDDKLRTISVVAKTACKILSLPRQKVFKWIEEDTRFSFFIIRHLVDKLMAASHMMTSVQLLSINERILNCIYAHERMGNLQSVRKQTLVTETCASIRSVNRSIAWCVSQGYIKYEAKKIYVIDMGSLEETVKRLL